MSRKISIQVKKRWLELFEQGLTENQIARKEKRDLRTVVRGLQEASRDRHLANAEAEMLRNALSTHQDRLMSLLKEIAAMLVMPDGLQLKEDENHLLRPFPISRALVEMSPDGVITLKIHGQEKLEWELLEEHLKSERLWRYLGNWREAIVDYFDSVWKFKQAIERELEKKTGLKIRRQGNQPPEFITNEAVEIFYAVNMRLLLGIKDGTDLENNLEVTGEQIRHFTTELARSQNPDKCRDKMVSVYRSLPKLEEADRVKKTYHDLSNVTRLARRQAEEIILLGMIMGKCRVCARLGK